MSKATSDGLGDRLVQWWEAARERYTHLTTFITNLDNGRPNHNRHKFDAIALGVSPLQLSPEDDQEQKFIRETRDVAATL